MSNNEFENPEAQPPKPAEPVPPTTVSMLLKVVPTPVATEVCKLTEMAVV